MSLLSQFFSTTGGSSIKSIQRGVLSIVGSPAGSQTSVTVTSVTMSMAQLHNLGFAVSGGVADSVPYIFLANATTITLVRGSSVQSSAISWELIEWQ